MFQILKSMFDRGKITEEKIIIAFEKGWITIDQKENILQ